MYEGKRRMNVYALDKEKKENLFMVLSDCGALNGQIYICRRTEMIDGRWIEHTVLFSFHYTEITSFVFNCYELITELLLSSKKY